MAPITRSQSRASCLESREPVTKRRQKVSTRTVEDDKECCESAAVPMFWFVLFVLYTASVFYQQTAVAVVVDREGASSINMHNFTYQINNASLQRGYNFAPHNTTTVAQIDMSYSEVLELIRAIYQPVNQSSQLYWIEQVVNSALDPTRDIRLSCAHRLFRYRTATACRFSKDLNEVKIYYFDITMIGIIISVGLATYSI
jgi:hypothetical protein